MWFGRLINLVEIVCQKGMWISPICPSNLAKRYSVCIKEFAVCVAL